MKNFLAYTLLLLTISTIWSCKKDGNYPGATVSPYIALFDVRNLHKGSDVTLTQENMFGATQVYGVVVSDHSGGNLPEGMLMLQDKRRLNRLRGIVIPMGDAAATYVPGDSLIIRVDGAVLKNVNGVLQLTGITPDRITKVATGPAPEPLIVKGNQVVDNPGAFEGVLISIAKASFDPSYPPGSTYEGARTINDGFGNVTLYTEAGTSWANDALPFLSNFTGIVLRDASGNPQLRPRTENDITVLSATAPKLANIVVTGYLTDPTGADANYEYIQLMATKNIDFSVTPFSIVTTNNAGTNPPTGFPLNGWATGGLRTYKIDLTSGTVAKGEYFYVGANKNIWGAGSTDMSSSKWFQKMYSTDDGDGIGTKTNNLLANSGNAAGIAIFDKINVTETDVPVDVIFFGGGGNVFTAGPPEKGYRITNTDYYDVKNPTTLADQPFFNQGSNTGKFTFPATSNFSQLGGTYNLLTGRWTTARMLQSIPLSATATPSLIEGATMIEE